MGARTDEAERRVQEQRDKLSGMLAELENRVRHDMDEATAHASEQTSLLSDRLGKIPGPSTVSDRVHQHPLTSIAGGFTAGIALGMVSQGLGRGDDLGGSGSESSGGVRVAGGHSGTSGSNAKTGLVTALINQFSGIAMSSVAKPAKDELENYLRNAVTGFFEGRSDRGQQPQREEPIGTDQERLREPGDPVDPVEGNPGKA